MELKFFGILKEYNKEDLIKGPHNNSYENIKLLLSKRVMVEKTDNLKGETWYFWNTPEIMEEIYNFLYSDIKRNNYSKVEIDDLNFKLHNQLTLEKKINFLHKSYSELIENTEDFIMYRGSDLHDWKRIIYNSIEWSELEIYLFSRKLCDFTNQIDNLSYKNINSHFYRLYKRWEFFYSVDVQLEYIKSKIQEFEKEVNTTSEPHNNTTRQKATKKEVDSPLTLRGIFDNEDLYNDTMKLFVDNKIFEEFNSEYKLLKNKETFNLSSKRFACAIGYKLMVNNYLKANVKKTQITEALTNSIGVKVSKQIYNSFLADLDKQKTQDYLTPLFFIN